MERSQEHGEADQGVGVDEEARALCRAEQSRRESESESTPEPEPEPEPEPDAEQKDVMAVSVSLSKPQPRENGSVARSSAPVGVFAKLSKEQLIEYTKKQKKEIKKLKGEISQFHDERSAQIESNEIASNNNASFDLFWELLDRRPQWQQRLAKVSVSSLLGHAPTLQRAARATLHSAFYQWSAQTSRSYRSHIRGALQESKMTNAHLEQRVVKLKGLLAKVHHSNQKNVQDTQSARQGHRVAAEELRERVQEQQSQTQLLQQQLRYMSFESAFQTDMETAIEKASQQLTSHQQTAVGAHHVDNAHLAEKVVELEGHLQALRMEMDEKSEVINSLRKQLVSSQHDKAIADRELQLQRRRAADIRAENVLLQQCTREQDLVQRELELEVRALVAGGADMTARVDAAANEKAAQAVKELQESLHNAGEAVQREKQRADVAENKIERLGRDLATTRMKTSDLVKVRAENDRLSLLLRELKRSSMDLNIQQVVTKTTSTPEKIEMRGETDYISMERRVLGYLLHPFDDVKMAQLFEDSVDQTNRIVTSIDQLKRFHSSNVCMTTPFGNGNCSSKSVIAKAWMAELCKDFSSSLGLNCVERCLQDIEPTDSVREIIADVIVHESDVQINIGNMNHDTYTGDESLLARYAACSVRLKELERDALNISFASMRNHLTKVDGEGTQCILTDLPSPREVEVFNWNASSITLLAGREINLPVPFPHGQKVGKRCRYFLKWQIRGSQLDSLQLELHPLGNDSVIPTLVLDSAHTLAARFDGDDRRSSSNDEGTFVLHGVTALQGGRDQMLRISNIASWVTASISYTIKLCTTIVADSKVCEGVEERKLVKGSTVSPASALSSFSVHHECIRGKVIEGLHLWSTLQSQLEEWRTLSASFEILCRSRFDELTLQFCDDARTRRAFVEELSHQYSSFQGNVELVEKHFTDDAMFHVRGQAPLSAQLDIPHHQCSKDDKHNGGDKSEIHGHLPCHSVDANFNLRTVFCAAELKIRPAQDFRCPLRTPLRKDVEEGYYLISWDFELLDESKPSLTRSGTVPSLDIGFCVLAKELDGSLPQLKPYRRINNCDREGMTGSLRYRVSDDRTRHSKLIDGPFHSEICAPFQEIVVLFDNSYSWVTPKLLRYEVSVEFVLEKLLLELQEDPLPGVNSSTSVDVVHGKSDEHAHTSERALDFNLPADEVGHNQNGTNINSILVTDRDRIITVRSGVDVVVDQSQTQHRLEQAAIAMDEAAHRVLVTAVEVRQFCSDVFMMNGSAKSNDEFY